MDGGSRLQLLSVLATARPSVADPLLLLLVVVLLLAVQRPVQHVERSGASMMS
jgi:hypothetical protein